MPALLAFAPVILEMLMLIIKWFAEKTMNDKQKKEFYKSWMQLARVLNLKDLVEKHKHLEDQFAAGDAEWDRIEAEEAAKKKVKK